MRARFLTALTNLRSRPEALLIVMSVAMPLSLGTWMALINNFSIEQAAFTGVEIGVLHSLREIPGLLAFAVVFLLLFVREQPLALISLMILGLGVAVTGFFPSTLGLYVTTVVMSVGFHYFETVRQSLSLQWLKKDEAAAAMGRMIGAGSFASILTYGLVYVGVEWGDFGMAAVYLLGGGLTVAVTLFAWLAYPSFPQEVEQHKHIVLRPRYWLYYALTFFSGARRQIFVVFAGFLMVEKFGFSVAAISLMFLANHVINTFAAPLIGKLIGKWGERKALTFEYIGLIILFVAYAFVETAWIAVILYIVDHLFFALAIAMKTYFQKIAHPADIAPTSGVAFSINHIAAVVIPAVFGLLWLTSPAIVFLAGAAMAGASLVLARLVPENPQEGREVTIAALCLGRSAERIS